MLHLAILANAANYHLRRWLPALADRHIRITLGSFVDPTETIRGVTFRRLRRPTRLLGRHSLVDFLLAGSVARRFLDETKPDVLMGSYATNYGYMAARSRWHPFVLQTWTADVQLYPRVGAKSWILGPLVRRSLRGADLVTTDGPALKDDVLRSFPFCAGKTESILWGIELDEFLRLNDGRIEARRRLSIPDDAVVVTCARGIRFHDRPEVSLVALLDVIRTDKKVHGLVLTLGRDPDPRIKDTLELLRAHDRCRVVDQFLGKDDVKQVWAASDLVVSVPMFDGISEAMLEAMAAGCIPVLSDIPPNRIIVPDPQNAIFSRADTAQTLKDDVLSGLGRLDQLKSTAVEANRAWVRENASIARAADRLSLLLVELAGTNRR